MIKNFISSLINNSFRRNYLDFYLKKSEYFYKGKVLDIGGKKSKRRGNFTPPLDAVHSWEYLNNSKDSEPDYHCDASSIPLDEKTFDTILLMEVIEYLPYPEKVINEIYRVLKNDGYLIVSSPLIHPVHGDFKSDRRRFTSVSLKEILDIAGFQIISIETMGSVGAVIYDILLVAGGYANKNNNLSLIKYILPFFKPIFILMDKIFHSRKDFINTGYFIIAKKNNKS